MICKLFLFQINVAAFSSGEVRFFWLNATVLKHTLVGYTFTLEWSLVMLSLMRYSCKCMELIASLLRAAHPLICLFFPRNFGQIYYHKFFQEKDSAKVKSSWPEVCAGSLYTQSGELFIGIHELRFFMLATLDLHGLELRGRIVYPCTDLSWGKHLLYAVDREIFARTNIRLLNFRIVLFSSPQHTGSAASFVLFDNFRRCRVPTKIY